jgi:intermediate cleaving peptidase 55
MRPLTTVTFIRSLARRNLTRKPLRHVVARSKLIAAFSTTASWITPPPRLGQPTHETHPHLLKSGEGGWGYIQPQPPRKKKLINSRWCAIVTQGCSAIEYAVRRAKLASQLPEGGVAIIPAATLKYRSGPVFYEFHQDPDFYYLTGFLEQDAVAVIGM